MKTDYMGGKKPNLVFNGKKWTYRCIYWIKEHDPWGSLDRFWMFHPKGRWSIHSEDVEGKQEKVLYFERLSDLFHFKLTVL